MSPEALSPGSSDPRRAGHLHRKPHW